jgi:flagellin
MMRDLGKLMNIGLDLETDYLSTIDSYLSLISEKQVEFGATENRLMSALDSISANVVGLASSHSTIRDADMAEVSSTYIQQQILQDASATMMAMSRSLRAESLLGIIQSLS